MEEICSRFRGVYPVNYNCPGQVTVAGLKSSMSAFCASVKDAKDRTLPLKVSGGSLMGEGAAALVLEEYEHALSRGAKICGEVVGYGSTCDAYHTTAPKPDAGGGTHAMVQALKEAGYQDTETVYVNAHCTGTPLNDTAETQAIKNALGEKQAYENTLFSPPSP